TPYRVATERALELAGTPFAAGEVRAGTVRALDRKLDKLIVAGVHADATAIELALRTGRDRGTDGVDVRVERGGRATRIARVRRGEAGGGADVDPGALAALAVELDAMLAARPGRLEMVTIDGVPLDEHERPSLLIDRVFVAMAPVVREIASR